ncbi:MAG: GNAT family N-acetyltransferase, partial [Ignavibacteriales bacterium]
MSTKNLERIFNPESIALIGVSEREGSVGFGLFKNLISGGFRGKIYGVNPKINELLGQKIYKSVKEIKGAIDLAVISVSIGIVPSVVRECAERGIMGAIVISAGGKEAGEAGSEKEKEIVREAGRIGMRIIGPNCLGIVVPHLGMNASFTASVPPQGNMAFISQSGALCTAIMDWACREKVGFSHVVSIGDMADVDFGDVINYLGDDISVRSILLYIESLTNVKKFIGASRSVSRIKPIIALKSGQTQAGMKAAASHTGALTTEDAIYNTVFKRAGIIKVNTIRELFNAAEAFAKQPRPIKPNFAIITNAGGPGVMATDALGTKWRINPVQLNEKTIKELDSILPPYASKLNPIDILGDATPERYAKTLEVCLAAEEVGGVIIIFTPQIVTHPSDVARTISEVAKKHSTKSIFAVWMGGKFVEEAIGILNDTGIPTFGTPEEAVHALMHMYSYTYNLKLLQETPRPIKGRFEKKRAESIINSFLKEKESEILSELDSKAVIASYDIPVNPTEVATASIEASQIAKELGFPVVLKIHSPDITHKSNVGGVALDLNSEAEVSNAFDRIVSNVKRLKPDANILGVTVQPMVTERGFELILGAKKDPIFGPVIAFGAGGVMTEFIKDVEMAIPPLNSTLALRLIERTRIFSLLSNGFRDIPPANMDALVNVIVNFSELIADFPEITEADINPLYVTGEHILALDAGLEKPGKRRKGERERILALDARIKIERTEEKPPHHLIIAPYPSQYESYHTLKDGTVVLLRPIRPEDEPLMFELFNTFSKKTIAYRFFHFIKVTTHEQLIRFTQIDYDREIAIIAVCQPPGRERVLGVGQVIFEPREEKAEFAAMVGDPWQGKGLGGKLIEACISIAKERGVKLLWGEVIFENRPMINLFKKMGFNIEKRDGSLYAELKLGT